ncbi:MAG: PilW family protein [Betaproteobacteria bacterium]|nr:PilW family protein [Betaproteobacteria bacterium]
MNGLKEQKGRITQKGVTLVELMVASLIGMLAMYAVYRVYEGTERTKRAVVSVGDAQVSGLYSTFLLEESIQNAGSGMMFSKAKFINCPNDSIGAPGTAAGTPVTLSLKPLPVVIDPNKINTNFDDLYVFAGRSPVYIMPVSVNGTSANTPFGFNTGSVLVDIQNGACTPYLVTAAIAAQPENQPVSTPVDTNVTGANGAVPPNGASLVDLGVPSRLRYFVDSQNVLQAEVWQFDPALTGQWVLTRTDPIVSGVMLMKAQYGIDTTAANGAPGTGITDWIDPADTTTPGWDIATLQATTNVNVVNQIKAIRLALVVRADEPENSATFNQSTSFTMFQDCPTATGANCPNPITVTYAAGTGPGGTTYRYRMYEKVIPLRNTLYNL